MKKTFVIGLVFLVFGGLGLPHPVRAEPPIIITCQIEGIVQAVRFSEAWRTSCPGPGCFTDTLLAQPAGHWINIKITKVEAVKGGYTNLVYPWPPSLIELCRQEFAVDAQRKFFLEKKKRNAGPPKTGQKIEGVVRTDFMNYLLSYKNSSVRNMNLGKVLTFQKQ